MVRNYIRKIDSVEYPPGHIVFTDLQENLLVKYLNRSSDTKHGLTTRDTRKWAHDYARKLQLKCPENFSTNLTAEGKDWLAGFLNKVTLTEGQNFDLPKFSCLTDGENELLLCWKSFNLSQKLRQGFQLDNQVAKEKRQSSLKKKQ
ncbi:hypothetical protein DAPPUDRAFT_318817 [Daphnia pulex]|uniref:HTH CENPB-type domain-containing protein n=1 Tax=Daphnia pulex TaxID=6669 RepID=E9GJR3_DAPPU|nr:hypothetical protein DAPPUDRAFT_318817 [Daphnia pulex]|eukprot:EFX80155.1 hypothetical protein DAPPUDRAFT_318817 [Daphnia pulex]